MRGKSEREEKARLIHVLFVGAYQDRNNSVSSESNSDDFFREMKMNRLFLAEGPESVTVMKTNVKTD